MKKQTPNTDAQRRRLHRVTSNSYFRFFIFSHSIFDVGRSMFDVH